MNDSNMQTVSMVSTAVLTATLSLLVWKTSEWTEAAAATKNPYEDMEVIDASLAELPKKPQQQPQKKFKAPEPEAKPLGVSRDETREPVTKPEEPPRKPVATPSLEDFRRDNTDSDRPVGKPEQEPIGAFDGSEFGFGDETRGDPYLGALKADLLRSWEYPAILSDVGTPVGCLHIEPDGKIEEVELREKSGNDELDDSVERALAGLQKLRSKAPRPVPAHLIPKTRKWICWRMKVNE
jgi:outer membrane biosynthesis protein TonB